MNGSGEGGESEPSRPPARSISSRTQSDNTSPRHEHTEGREGTTGLGRAHGSSAFSSSVSLPPPSPSMLRNGDGTRPRMAETAETWFDFLRTEAPRDIVAMDASDPIRQAYVRNRRAQAMEEARKRRRGATTSTRGPPPVPARPHASSASSAGNWTSYPGSLSRLGGSGEVERPLPRLPNFDGSGDAAGGEYVVPRWQPDAQVSNCPICDHGFSFLFRRHHCRKCGRVVCANCSPHRITIPRQFMVHSPDEQMRAGLRTMGDEAVDPTDDGEQQAGRPRQDTQSNSALGGGQEVRLCNPCVPDPNPLHPPTYPPSPGRSSRPQSWHPGAENASSQPSPFGLYGSSRYFSSHAIMGPNTNFGRSEAINSRHMPPGPPSSNTLPPISGYRTPYGSAPTSSYNGEFTARGYAQGWLQPTPSSRPHHRARASTSNLPSPRDRAQQVDGPLPPTPPPPPPPIREEDECPVCHCELPPKGPDGSENLREAHVTECIETHFSSSGPRISNLSARDGSGAPASTSTSARAPGERPSNPASSGESAPAAAGTSKMQRRRTTGMVVYHASEKDCIGEDGGQQECVICFEEFAVGDGMGRLECLCKFHKACIRQWWDTKGVGACPVHQENVTQ